MISSIYSPEILKDDYTICVQAYYIKDWHAYTMPLHAHDQMEIMYVMNGRCVIRTADNEVNLKKNEFILLDANRPHSLNVDSDCRMMNIEFTLVRKSAGLSFRLAANQCPHLKSLFSQQQPACIFVDSEDVFSILRKMLNALDGNDEASQFEVEVLSVALFMAISRISSQERNYHQAYESHVRRAIQFMNQNYYQQIDISAISSHVGITPAYLSRVFRKSTGETIGQYLTNLRIKKAKMLLSRTVLPIIEISGYIGIPSRQYFCELFRKHAGMTPSEYRGRTQAAPKLNPGCR